MSDLIKINGADLKHMVKKVLNEVVSNRKKLNEEDEKTYSAIGFASKFYTLWYITERVERTPYGVYERTLYQFVKSISTDLDRAKEKYPDAVFIPDLRGHRSFERTKKISHGPDEFKSGKYAGQKVADCQDYSYLAYILQNSPYILPDGYKEVVEDMLTQKGYRIENHDYGVSIETPEEVRRKEEAFEKADEFVARIEAGDSIEVVPTGNLNEEGVLTVKIADGLYALYQFPEGGYKIMYYSGYYYGLPLDAKGKGKKIKGKKLIITPGDYEVEDGYNVEIKVKVKDFQIMNL